MKSIYAEKDYCPNCWGKQEYQGKIVEAAEKANVDLNNIEEQRGWIQAYAAKHLQQLKLRKDDGKTCSVCKS